EKLATIGITCSADDLLITAGANHAFTLALTTLVTPGDEVILPAPYFTNHEMAVVVCTPSNPTGAVIDPAEGARIIAQLRTRRIVLFSDETYMHFVYEGA